MKTSNKILLTAFIIVLLALITGIIILKRYVSTDRVITQNYDIEETYAFNSNGIIDLEAKDCNIHIEIEGWENDSIQLKLGFFRDEESANINRDFFVTDSNATIKFLGDYNTHNHHPSLACKIKIPLQTNIKYNIDGGAIKLDNITGNIDGNTGGGIIKANSIEGEVRMSTGGGVIELKDINGQGKINTGGGKITVDKIYGTFEVSTGGGTINVSNSEFMGKVSSGGGKLIFNQVIGEINVSSGGGKIATTDCEITGLISTGGGSINVNNAKNAVKTKSGGGNLYLENIAGSVEGETGGGNIYSSIIPNKEVTDYHVNLRSGGGEINLDLHKELGYNFDIEIKTKKSQATRYKIINDFNLTTEIKDAENEPEKVIIKATGTYGSGDHNIVIRTNSSDVHIKN